MSTDPLLSVAGLHSGYGRIPILTGVELTVAPGEVVGILGHNGMGKTTLMRTLVGALPARSGTVRLNGLSIEKWPTHKRARAGLGYVPQGRDIFANLTVRENILIGALAAGKAGPSAVETAVRDFPVLKPLLDRRGGALSGGEQQILALARALSGAPSVLLLDEPTEGIQPSVVEEIEAHIERLTTKNGLAVIVVEQDLDFIATLAHRVLIIQKGSIRRELSPKDLNDPHTVDEFIGLES